MAKDQYTRQDPTSQDPSPEQLAGQEQPHPGSNGEIGPEPDHGERAPTVAADA